MPSGNFRLTVAWDERLAGQLAVVALLSMSLNHVLETLLAIPRPFVAEDRYREA